ncbi:hypothetical protein VTP01DRAFT_898 [Rhizomucor pusillus]|uniref:uncharacterized protein n=1 Tax=Rhizomucor pusillus TaxID=4840 RepID=UPI00374369F0
MLNTSNSPDIIGNDAQEDSVEGTDIQSSLDECEKIEGYFYVKANGLSILVLCDLGRPFALALLTGLHEYRKRAKCSQLIQAVRWFC